MPPVDDWMMAMTPSLMNAIPIAAISRPTILVKTCVPLLPSALCTQDARSRMR